MRWRRLNYRIVRTLTVLFLPLLAIPMGLTSRRQPTSIRIVVGIAILIVYYQVLNFGKDMAENGRVSSFVALWVPFLLFSLGSTVSVLCRELAPQPGSVRGRVRQHR